MSSSEIDGVPEYIVEKWSRIAGERRAIDNMTIGFTIAMIFVVLLSIAFYGIMLSTRRQKVAPPPPRGAITCPHCGKVFNLRVATPEGDKAEEASR